MSSRVIAGVLAFLVVFGLSAGWMAPPVRADLTISAAPSLLEVSATPGGVGSQEISVTNAGTEPFRVNAEPVQYKGGDGALSAVSWLQVEPAGFELQPGQRQAVKVTVRVPADANSGGRYAMIAFRTGEKPSGGSAVGVAAQVGVPFLITVKGPGALTRQPSLGEMMPVIESSGGLGFRAVVENRGSTHFYARGAVQFNDTSGRPWGRLNLRDSTAILPGTKELLFSDQALPFKDGESYRARAEVSFGEGSPEVKEIEFKATPALKIDEVLPRPTDRGELEVLATLSNSGTIGLLPRLPMAIRSEEGKIAGVLTPDVQPVLWPGQSLEVKARYSGRLAPGKYTLVARAEFASSSVQVERRFEVTASTGTSTSAVPVSKWAEAPTIQAPEVAASIPVAPVPSAERPAFWAAALSGFLPTGLISIAAVAILGLTVLRVRRRPRATAYRHAPRIALNAPISMAFGLAEHLLGRRRARPTRRALTALLPPAPVLLLPPPAASTRTDEPIAWLSIEDATSYLENAEGELRQAGHDQLRQRETAPSYRERGSTGPTPQRTRSGLSRAVAEKAAALAAEAASAAELGDRAAVDRFSRQALQLDPWNIDAWLWLAASCEDRKSALMCLEAVLLLDPSNPRAKRGFAILNSAPSGNGSPDSRLWEVVVDGGHRAGPVHHRSN